jgi:hypothetical protein
MKPLFSALFLLPLLLSSPSGKASDPVASVMAAQTRVVAAASDLRLPSPASLSSAVQVAAISSPGAGFGTGNLTNASRGRDEGTAEALPSTPIALATLFLIICILVGRRNS